MHDTTLRRTTNVEEAFPELAHRPASMLNWTVLQRLNAGQWFLKVWWHLPRSECGERGWGPTVRAGRPSAQGTPLPSVPHGGLLAAPLGSCLCSPETVVVTARAGLSPSPGN